jgi:hypothetical protein
MRRAVAVLALAAVALTGCKPAPGQGGKGGPDGETRLQFHHSVYLKFNTTYVAHHGDFGCRWRIESVKKSGKEAPVVQARGTYTNAKIKVEEPDTVDVYLIFNHACGNWVRP